MDWGSVFNWLFEFFLWLVGCLHVIGCVGGLCFFVWVVFLGMQKPQKLDEENRCRFCKDYHGCPAVDSGVSYPCLHFEPVDEKEDRP